MRFSLLVAATMAGSASAMFPAGIGMEDPKNKHSAKTIVQRIRENRHRLQQEKNGQQQRHLEPTMFEPPLAFTQYMGGCSEENFLISGMIESLEVLDEDGAFCLVDMVTDEDGNESEVYTKYVIDECTADGIFESYYTCDDSSCSSGCEANFIAYSPPYGATSGLGACFNYTYSTDLDDTDSLFDGGSSFSIQTQFDDDNDLTVVVYYLATIAENSCVADAEFDFTVVPSGTDDGPTVEEAVEEVIEDAITGDDCTTITDAACDNDYTVLCELLKGDDELTELFATTEDGFTFFAPSDEAFEEVAGLFDAATPEQAESILGFHLHLGGIIAYEDLECTQELMMANGTPSRTRCDKDKDGISAKYQKGGGNRKNDNLPLIDNATLVCNGVIYTVDAVMLPNAVPEIPGLFD